MSYLTQKLFRNETWAVLNKSRISSALKQTAEALTLKFTKKSLGKAVPVIGIGLGFTLNLDTVTRTIETAEMAYRRRFLLDKYPHLAESEPTLAPQAAGGLNEEGEEEVISIIDLLGQTDTAPSPADAPDQDEVRGANGT